jgi:hypothetical protein
MERSLTDLIRFLDQSGSMSDSDISNVSQKIKFTDVLDVVTSMSKGDEAAARSIMAKYDDRFTVAQEYSSVPTANKPSGFKPIKPVGSSPTMAGRPTNPNGPQAQQAGVPGQPNQQFGRNAQQGQGDEEQDVNNMLLDPANKNKPEVRQIQSLLQRMQQR